MNYRFWVLMVLMMVSLVGLLSEPVATTTRGWLTTFVISKLVGAITAAIWVRLFAYWAKRGEIDCLTKLIEED